MAIHLGRNRIRHVTQIISTASRQTSNVRVKRTNVVGPLGRAFAMLNYVVNVLRRRRRTEVLNPIGADTRILGIKDLVDAWHARASERVRGTELAESRTA